MVKQPHHRIAKKTRRTNLVKVVKGQASEPLTEAAFRERFATAFADPAFMSETRNLHEIATIAWRNYDSGRKAPVTRPAGKGFADPHYQLSVEWRGTRDRLIHAEAIQRNRRTRSRVLVIAGAARNDGSCPGEMSKTYRLARMLVDTLQGSRVSPDLLDLSLLTSDYRRYIHPCKGCVSTAMPLCHWPCSCYPNHATGQTADWMAEIYERWVSAHGIIIVTPVYWYQAPSVLKLMIDRMVCADGGNPDPTATSGKDASKAKQLELAGWDYPKHLAGRVYGVIVHGDVQGTEAVKRALCDWLDWMGLVAAGPKSRLDRYIGYYEPYASSHRALDAELELNEEVRNVARAVAQAVRLSRAGKLREPGDRLRTPRPKWSSAVRYVATPLHPAGFVEVKPVQSVRRGRVALTDLPALAWEVLRTFRANQGFLLAGAVAYYTLLALVPLLVLIVIGLSHVIQQSLLFSALSEYLRFLVPGQDQAVLAQLRTVVAHRELIGGVLVLTMLVFSAAAFTILENAMSVIFFHRVKIRRRHFMVSATLPYLFILLLGIGLLVAAVVAGKLAALATREIAVFGAPYSLEALTHYLLYAMGVGGEILVLTAIYLVMPVGGISWRQALIGGVTAGILWEITRHLLVWYYATLSKIQVVYGSFAASIAVLFSVEIAAIFLLLGAQVIATYEQRRRGSAPNPIPLAVRTAPSTLMSR